MKDFAGKHKYAILVMAIKCLPVWIFSNFNIFNFLFVQYLFQNSCARKRLEFLFNYSDFVVAATNLGVLVSILVPDVLKATQILMVIASPAFYYQWFYLSTYAMPEFIANFTKIIPLTPYLEALKIMVVQHGSVF